VGVGSVLTFGSYVALVVLWGSIVVLYAARLRETRANDPLVAALLVVVLVDAAKNVVESAYFGALWGSRFSLLPSFVGTSLENPLALAVPTTINVAVAVFVIVRIVGGFFPRELADRQRRSAERERLQEELERSLALVQESEGRLQSLLERTSDVVAFWRVVDANLVLESVNQAGRTTLGFGDEAIGTSWRKLAPPSLQSLLDAALETGQPQREEEGFLNTPSGRRAVIRQIVPLPDEDGVIRRVASFTQDVTALRERQAAEEARTRLESLGILAGGVAHDFNNLLAVLRADLTAARGDGDTGAAFDHAQVTIDRARDLVTQLLAMAGKRAPVTGAVDVGAVARDTARLLLPGAPAGATLVVEASDPPDSVVAHDGAPAGTIPVVIGDRTQLQQICLNLMQNGLDAVAATSGAVRAKVSVEADHVVLTVRDDGPGIDIGVQRRIFEPFFTTKPGGRGLGLATVFGLARAHGGSVEVTSTPGHGATFTVKLPHAKGVAAPSDVAARQEAVASPTEPGQTPREAKALAVLLIDDDDRVRRATRRLLERLGHTIIDVSSGGAGLAVADAYDIAVVDVTMPDLDGPTTLVRLRESRPGLPAVLVTGRGDVAGDSDIVLTKPFDEVQLQESLQRALDVRARAHRR